MKPIPAAEHRDIKGFLPFYSVDTREEADALIEEALRTGEFARNDKGELVEVALAYEQTPAGLIQAGDRLAALHLTMKGPS